MTRLLGLMAALFLALPVHAHSVTAGDIEIIHPNIPQPANSAKAAGGYMGISNAGDQPDRLIGVETTVAKSAMLHKTEINADGQAIRRPRRLSELIAVSGGDEGEEDL